MVRKKTVAKDPAEDEITDEIPVVEPVEENVFEQPEIDGDKSFDEVVDEVIRGDWGVGQTRRLALAKAGYDPNEIQQEVVRRANSR